MTSERLMAVDRVGPQGVARLAAAGVAIFGVGAIGWWLAQLLVSLFGRVILLDRGVVEPANLGVQGFQEIDLGLSKVSARRRALQHLNRDCRIDIFHGDVRDLGLGAFGHVDLAFVAFDSRAARVVANQFMLRRALPWIDLAVDGSGRSLIGRAAAHAPDGGCYLCSRDAADLAAIMRENSAGCPAWSWGRAGEVESPTRSIPSLAAAVAGIGVTMGVRMFLDGPADVAGREVLIDLGRDAHSLHRLRRNPNCLADHRAFRLTPAARATVWQTFRDAAAIVGEPVSLELQRRGIAGAIRCPECRQERRPYKLLDAIAPGEGECACGTVMQPVAGLVLDSFTIEQAAPFLSHTWDQLGLPPADVVVARGPEREADLCLI